MALLAHLPIKVFLVHDFTTMEHNDCIGLRPVEHLRKRPFDGYPGCIWVVLVDILGGVCETLDLIIRGFGSGVL